jgi:hypothetical protein
MGLPEYAHGYRTDVPLTPDDVFPSGGASSPLDVMDSQEKSIFAAAFTSRTQPLSRPGRPNAYADPEDEAELFRQAFD